MYLCVNLHYYGNVIELKHRTEAFWSSFFDGRFNDKTDTEGYVDENSRGHCIAPLLYETGWISVQVSSDNGTTFSRVGAWLSGRTSSKHLPETQFSISRWCVMNFIWCVCIAAVHTGKLQSKFKATLVNSTQWQYYGTPNVEGFLEMTWNTSLVRGEKVNIELWGYRETGEYTSINTVTYKLWRSHDSSCQKSKLHIYPLISTAIIHLICFGVRSQVLEVLTEEMSSLK